MITFVVNGVPATIYRAKPRKEVQRDEAMDISVLLAPSISSGSSGDRLGDNWQGQVREGNESDIDLANGVAATIIRERNSG